MFRPVSYSRTIISELMIPSYTNFGGKVHGGTLLSLMDKVAYVCASKHAGNYCVTASIDTVDFLQAVEVGEMIQLHASVNYVGKSSMIVGIKAVAENFKDGLVKHTNTSFFTMVAMDAKHKPVKVPGLILENNEDIRRFLEAKTRKLFKFRTAAEFKAASDEIHQMHDLSILEGENCQIKLSE